MKKILNKSLKLLIVGGVTAGLLATLYCFWMGI
jgi:hypothetical protein